MPVLREKVSPPSVVMLDGTVLQQQEADFGREEAERGDRFRATGFGDVEDALEDLSAVFGDACDAAATTADDDGAG